MHCHACQDWLKENWVDLPRAVFIQNHLADCACCRAQCREIARLANALEGMPVSQPPEGLRQKILAAISKPELRPVESRRVKAGSGWRGRTTLLVAACILVGAMGPVLPNLFRDKSKSTPQIPAPGEVRLASHIQPGSILLKPWPEWKDALQEEGMKALETAYRCVRPPAEAGWITMTRAIREVPGPFLLSSGD